MSRNGAVRALLLGVLAVALDGCAHASERFRALPANEQGAFQRCVQHIYPSVCGSDRDAIYANLCLNRKSDDYAVLADRRARAEWLVANGCPTPVALPAETVDQIMGPRQ